MRIKPKTKKKTYYKKMQVVDFLCFPTLARRNTRG